MTGTTRRALLGRLAGLGWFTRRGEVAATQALAMLLEDPTLAEATLRLLGSRSSTDLTAVTKFQAEAVHEDGARPDLEGVSDDGVPLIMVEAKFGAALTVGQLRAYFDDQSRRLGTPSTQDPGRVGVIVLMVPPHRVAEAERAHAALVAQRVDAGLPPYPSRFLVVGWDTWLDDWDAAVAGLPATSHSVAADLVQLRELCLTLGGLHMRPLEKAASGPDWTGRAGDLATLVDQVTQQLRGPDGKTLPIQHEAGYDPMRYISGGYRLGGSSCSVGLASRFANEGASPLWLRYHRSTPHFSAISDAIFRSELRLRVRTDDRHLWLPLLIRPDLAGEQLVEDLVAQVWDVRRLLGGDS